MFRISNGEIDAQFPRESGDARHQRTVDGFSHREVFLPSQAWRPVLVANITLEKALRRNDDLRALSRCLPREPRESIEIRFLVPRVGSESETGELKRDLLPESEESHEQNQAEPHWSMFLQTRVF